MQGIILDFNGTLIFDGKLQEDSWKDFIELKSGHVATDWELQNHLHGRNVDYIFSYFFKKQFTREEVVALEEEKEVIYRKMCLESEDFKFAKGVEEMLDYLKESKIPFTIATASGYGNITFFYEQLILKRWFKFEDIVYNDGTFKGKPAPDIFLKAAEKINTDIKDCIIFEDSQSGIKAAISSGAKKVIGVASMIDKKTLLDLGANEIIEDYTNFADILK